MRRAERYHRFLQERLATTSHVTSQYSAIRIQNCTLVEIGVILSAQAIRWFCSHSQSHNRMTSSPTPVLVYCPCLSPLSVTRPPPSQPPLSTLRHHELSTLLFCEECDEIRCDACAQQEIACYYCPNCLFEVPSASVRAEKNRFVVPKD